MDIKNAQKTVDNWIRTHGVRYFNELTNLIYSSRGLISLNNLNDEITLNIKELQKIKTNNATMEVKIKNIVEFNDSDLVDQTIREYLGYAQEDDYIIKLK